MGNRRFRSYPLWLWSFLVIGSLSAVGGAALARVLARLPVVPYRRHSPDCEVVAADGVNVLLKDSPAARQDGRFAIQQQGDAVSVRVSAPVAGAPVGTVRRRVQGDDGVARPEPGPAMLRPRYFAGTPRDAFDVPMEEIDVQSPVGSMPSWFVPAADGSEKRAVILLHGHGGERSECLRAIPVFRKAGWATLTITYRNDLGAAPTPDGLFHLGSDEWKDVDAAIETLEERGIREVIVFGFSMGGGIALRTAVKTQHPEAIRALVLDGPAVDWRDILSYQAKLYKAPSPVRRLALWLLGSRAGARLVALEEPIALSEMSAEYLGKHLAVPTLLIHSLDDDFVPVGPSLELADAAREVVEFVPFQGAGHTREWNQDPARWEDSVTDFLVRLDHGDLDVGRAADRGAGRDSERETERGADRDTDRATERGTGRKTESRGGRDTGRDTKRDTGPDAHEVEA